MELVWYFSDFIYVCGNIFSINNLRIGYVNGLELIVVYLVFVYCLCM